MIHALVILAQLTVVPPSLPVEGAFCDENVVTTTLKIGTDRLLTVQREPSGRPIRAILKRVDGKPMTCDAYFAWVSHDFACGQGCSNPYTANGHAGGTSRSNACTNARNDGCSQTACSPGTYQYCGYIEAVSGVYYNAGGTCGYQDLHDCLVNDNCS